MSTDRVTRWLGCLASECTAVSTWLPVLLNPTPDQVSHEKPVMCEPQYAEASWYH